MALMQTPVGTLPRAAELLLPAGGTAGEAVAAGERWTLPGVCRPTDVVVFGASPLPSGAPAERVLAWSAGRERALLRFRIHPPHGLKLRAAHRLPPRRFAHGPRAAIRAAALGGLLVELDRGRHVERRLDQAVRDAGARTAGSMHVTTTGLLAEVVVGAERAILRAEPEPGDGVLTETSALERLDGHPHVAAALGAGRSAGTVWTLQARLPGTRPTHLTQDLLTALEGTLAALPRDPGGPTAPTDDLEAIRRVLPGRDAALEALGRDITAACSGVEGIARHGDLWLGNLLVDGDRLSGIVDWDGWHPSAVPGTDLIHLLATDRRHRRREPLGAVLSDREWCDRVLGRVRRYHDLFGSPLDAALRDAIAHAWWAGQIAGDLRREPSLALDRTWVAGNVDAVLDRR